MDKKKVLVFPAGSEIAMEIYNALKYSKFIKLFGGISVSDHAELIYKDIIYLPTINESEFIEELNKKIVENKIDVIYPALDAAQRILIHNQDKIKATIISADADVVDICADKDRTYKFFEGYSFIPKTFELKEVKSFPVFVKPKVGCGSIGAKKVKNLHELNEIYTENNDIVICEYLNGEEYTVDCLTNNEGELLVCKLRNRARIKSGISVRSQLFSTPNEVLQIAKIINSKLKFKGAWFFQLKKDIENNFKLMEISARIPGTMGVSRQCGINFPLLSIYLFFNEKIEIIDNKYNLLIDRAFINRYKHDINYETVYVDYDDTIILPNGNINEYLMMFLYQCINNGKKLILITKHIDDIYEKLKQRHIDKTIFNEIIHLQSEENKVDFIKDKNAIFIDDSFKERINVSKLGIPVFDLDMVESLIEWKM